MKNILVLLSSVILFSCSGENKKNESAEVFKAAVNVPCGSGVGESVQLSESNLTQSGIDVLGSRCANLVDLAGYIDCEHFEKVNIHTIRPENVKDAISVGYIEIEALSLDYNLAESEIDCL